MKLIAIQLHGFKSFADSTEVRFHDGITAVIGPNGCGKSNISDALRWVLGEQRPSAIRGARMEEAIFEGTERRKPIQRAEVTLVLSNEDGRLPVPYGEVRISRTLFRGGESEYALNGTPCRLRDILDLCRDTGLGADAYAVIEGPMIDSILSDRAEERRVMFEEAAGIGRYKERRRMAARRLDEAEQDLARLNDVVREVESKVRSLAQQRGRARRYIEVRDRKISLEVALADRELAALVQTESRIEAELMGLRDAEAQEGASVHGTEAELERLRVAAVELDGRRSEAVGAVQECRDRIAQQEQARALAEERIRNGRQRLQQIVSEMNAIAEARRQLEGEASEHRVRESEAAAQLEELRAVLSEAERTLADREERRRRLEGRRGEFERARSDRVEREASLRAEIESLETRAREAASALESLAAQVESLERDRDELGARLEEARGEFESVRASLVRTEQELAAAREAEAAARLREREARARLAEAGGRLAAAEGRRAELEAEEHAGGGLDATVKALLDARGSIPGVHGLLAEGLRAPDPLAPALESFLGDYLEAVVVEGRQTVEAVRRWFRAERRGAGGVCLLPLDAVRDEPADLPPPLWAEGPAAPWLARLLRGVRIEAGEVAPGSAPAVSEQGESVDRVGAVRIGRTGASNRRLSQRLERERLAREIEALRGRADAAGAEAERAASALADAETKIREREERRRRLEAERGRLEGEARALEARHAHLTQERAAVGERRRAVEKERAERLERIPTLERELEALRARPAPDAPEAPPDLDAALAEWGQAHERVSALRVEEAQRAAALAVRSQALAAANRRLEELSARAGALAAERAAQESAVAAAGAGSAEAAARLETFFREREQAEAALSRLDEEVAAARRRVSDLETSLRKGQRSLRERSERRHALELQHSELEGSATRIRERLEAEWGRPLDALRESAETVEGDTESLRLELAELNERLHRLGPVNMLAEEEYREESERLAFLQAQREDLVRARDDLRATIRQINETAVRSFLTTFEKIRANFQRTFSTLFEGGRCDLWLEDPNDPLESPIEIAASPGGKRTQRIHLLSGGERALTALALLFAIYLVKPSPFCLLDEVDAPLDEANILRFVHMLEQFKPETQFVVITHNPRTIEAADWMYGVTMEEPGVSKIVGVDFAGLSREGVA